jgi:hypothetical protein
MHHPLARIRPLVAGDAKHAADWIVRDFPVPPRLADDLAPLLARLLATEVLRGAAVEYLYASSLRLTLAAFGLTSFLNESYATQYLAAPFPHLELALLHKAYESGGAGQFLSLDQVAKANGGEGLTAFPLLWLQRSVDPLDPEAQALQLASQQSFTSIHRGYRLLRILKVTTADRTEVYRAGGFRERHRIPVGTPVALSKATLGQEHVVFEANRKDFDGRLPGSSISHIFVYREPRCGFTRFEQQVLERAVEHHTDEEIAASLNVSPAAVTLRWRSIYARIEKSVPLALRSGPNSSSATRGKEKRRKVVAFVDMHPEEIRPYA